MEFEKNLKELEKLVDQMSSGDIGLDKVLKSFEKGMQLIKKCQQDLSRAEKKVEKLIKVHEDGKIETEDIDTSDIES